MASWSRISASSACVLVVPLLAVLLLLLVELVAVEALVDAVELSDESVVGSVLALASVGGGPGGGPPAPCGTPCCCELVSLDPAPFEPMELSICAMKAAMEAPIWADPADMSMLDDVVPEEAADDDDVVDVALASVVVLAAAALCCIICSSRF